MEHLRPFERRVLAMQAAGKPIEHIASMFRRSPSHIERVIVWSGIPRHRPAPRRKAKALENRVMQFRSEGMAYEDIAPRFNASPGFIRRVEGLAYLRRAKELLS